MNSKYYQMKPIWEKMIDCYEGAIAIKEGPRFLRYLPPNAVECEEGIQRRSKNNDHSSTFGTNERDYAIYNQYSFRSVYAQYENYFKDMISEAVGLMQNKAPEIKFSQDGDDSGIPEAIRSLNKYGNDQNDTLLGLKYRLNFNQMLYGRYGLLLDIVTDNEQRNPRFVITEYNPFKILDGDVHVTESGTSRLSWVLLDETKPVFDKKSKTWDVSQRKYRVLGLDRSSGTPIFYHAILDNDAIVQWNSFDIDNPQNSVPSEKLIYPNFAETLLDFIPFTVCNVNKLGIDEWDNPPMYDVAELCLGNFRTDSLYKMCLNNHATPTVVSKNLQLPKDAKSKKLRLGGWINLVSMGGNNDSNVWMLETSGSGMSEMREAKRETKETMQRQSVRATIEGAGANASGDAIRLRVNSGTASIGVIDQTGANAITEQLCFAKIWAGSTPEEAANDITFKCDTSYLGSNTTASEFIQLLSANSATGTPFFSNQTLWRIMESVMPDILPSYEDNEIQKEQDVVL